MGLPSLIAVPGLAALTIGEAVGDTMTNNQLLQQEFNQWRQGQQSFTQAVQDSAAGVQLNPFNYLAVPKPDPYKPKK